MMPPLVLIPRRSSREATPAWPLELELLEQQLELDVLAEIPLARRAARSSRRWSEREEERGIVNFFEV